ncbi:MAG: family 10 glycosylhydrolase, partial [Armatimonadetes bacterium]|nr:family 10 glycosylhydrolase [Armatimonadota bacterium]
MAGRKAFGNKVFFRFVDVVWLVILPVIVQFPTWAQTEIPPLYAYSSVGDNQWLSDWFPIDSPATVEAQFEYLSKTYGIKRMYWRGEQDRIWLRYCQFRRENPLPYGWWMDWLRYLNDEVKTNELAVVAARRHGMEIYVFSGLFDHAAQGDVGGLGIFPYVGEDRLRLQHPEWCPVDRWGERVSPGPIEFCYPEARKALISRWLHHVTKYGYDGLSLYTYIENFGLRYADEFGYNEPIVGEFKRRYGVDIRTEPFNKEAWYRLRGEYVTQFLRELHSALSARGKKLSIALERNNPNGPQVWGAITADLPGAGRIYMDWQRWAEEGIVDELCVWGSNDVTLSKVMQGCKGRAVKLMVMTTGPFDKIWKPFTEAGVTILGFVAPKCGLDRVTLEPTSLKTLTSPDWRLRMQTLADIGAGTLNAGADIVAALAKDPHVLVRRESLRTLGAIKAQDQVALLEAGLADKESSVR